MRQWLIEWKLYETLSYKYLYVQEEWMKTFIGINEKHKIKYKQ